MCGRRFWTRVPQETSPGFVPLFQNVTAAYGALGAAL